MRIDWWTLALQTANVLILIWLLGRFLFRPVADIVARRQDEANKLIADAAGSNAKPMMRGPIWSRRAQTSRPGGTR
jgi:F-type H+-transporting ATPase subunit b